MKKAIAIVCSDITQLGGIERVICNFSENLVRLGEHRVIIISINSDAGAPFYDLSPEVMIIHLDVKNSSNLLSRCFSYVGMVKKITKLCRDNSVDIILGTDTRLNVLLLFVGGRKLVKVACEHNNYNYATFYTSLARRISHPKFDAVVLLTKKDYANYGFCKNATVIPNSIPFSAKRLSDLKHNVIISAGRLEKVKGFDILIEAVSLIKNECDDWEFRIFGDGVEKENLVTLIGKKNLEGIVKMMPAVRDIENEYCNSSIYVLPSRQESFGLVLLEAKSCGLPVISFDCPNGPADIVRDGVDGILVENGNVEALAQAILKLIKDPYMIKKYGQESAKDIERFSPKCIFEMWETLFNELMRKR